MTTGKCNIINNARAPLVGNEIDGPACCPPAKLTRHVSGILLYSAKHYQAPTSLGHVPLAIFFFSCVFLYPCDNILDWKTNGRQDMAISILFFSPHTHCRI